MREPGRRIFALGVLLIVAAIAYGRGLSLRPLQLEERQIEAQALTVASTGGYDREGRVLPLFVHVDGELWLPPLPVYMTALLVKVAPRASVPSRWAAVAAGVSDVLLLYVLAVRCFRRTELAFAAALILLVTPSHVFFSRTATVDGVWELSFILGWSIGVTALRDPPSRARRWLFAVGAGSLGGSLYAQPSAGLMLPMFAIVTLVIISRTTSWCGRDFVPSGAAFAVALLPIVFWYVRFPATYVDTLGRWVLHKAHLRDPIAWARAASNWHVLAHVSDLFWDFFSPSHLFMTPHAPGLCGMLLSATVVPLAAGVYALGRHDDQHGTTAQMAPIVAAGCLIGPLAAAMFGSPRSDARGLVMVPFCVLLTVFGARALWYRGKVARVVVVIACVVALVQAGVCWP